jgi:ABC-type hemin transport system ATPase subunit
LVKTDALQQFRQVHRTLDGGAVALVGPRGAGKTTILEALTEDEWISGAIGRLLVIENAPLEYQPREFALHLYARLCQQVIQLDVSRHSTAASALGNQAKRYGMLAAFFLAVFTLGSIVNGSRGSRVISILDW